MTADLATIKRYSKLPNVTALNQKTKQISLLDRFVVRAMVVERTRIILLPKWMKPHTCCVISSSNGFGIFESGIFSRRHFCNDGIWSRHLCFVYPYFKGSHSPYKASTRHQLERTTLTASCSSRMANPMIQKQHMTTRAERRKEKRVQASKLIHDLYTEHSQLGLEIQDDDESSLAQIIETYDQKKNETAKLLKYTSKTTKRRATIVSRGQKQLESTAYKFAQSKKSNVENTSGHQNFISTKKTSNRNNSSLNEITTTFHDLGFHPILIESLNYSDIHMPTDIQCRSIPLITKGKDCILMSPTGSGKTLSYLLPLIQCVYEFHDLIDKSRHNANSIDNPLSHIRPWVILCLRRDLCAQVIQMIQQIDIKGLISIQSLVKFTDFPASRSKLYASKYTSNFSNLIASNRINPVIVGTRIRWGAVDVVVATPETFLAELKRFTGAPLFPACLVIDEADDHFMGTKSEHVLLDIIQIIRPRYPRDEFDIVCDPIEATFHKTLSTAKPPKTGVSYPHGSEFSATSTTTSPTISNIQQNRLCKSKGVTNALTNCILPDVERSDGAVRVIKSLPRHEISPIQLIFSGATVPDGRANTVGQRILQRWPTATSLWSSSVHHIGDRGNLHEDWIFLSKRNCDIDSKVYQLAQTFAEKGKIMKTLVFVNTAERCKALYSYLLDHNWPALILHGDLTTGQRMMGIDKFNYGNDPILIATDYGGRGIDFYNIDHIINLDFPKDAQMYLHRCGRAGRAGRKGYVTNMIAPSDATLASSILQLESQHSSMDRIFTRKRSLNSKIDCELDRFFDKDGKRYPSLVSRIAQDSSQSVKLTSGAIAKLWKQEQYYRSLPKAAQYARELDTKKRRKIIQLFSKKSSKDQGSQEREAPQHVQTNNKSASVFPQKQTTVETESSTVNSISPLLSSCMIGRFTITTPKTQDITTAKKVEEFQETVRKRNRDLDEISSDLVTNSSTPRDISSCFLESARESFVKETRIRRSQHFAKEQTGNTKERTFFLNTNESITPHLAQSNNSHFLDKENKEVEKIVNETLLKFEALQRKKEETHKLERTMIEDVADPPWEALERTPPTKPKRKSHSLPAEDHLPHRVSMSAAPDNYIPQDKRKSKLGTYSLRRLAANHFKDFDRVETLLDS